MANAIPNNFFELLLLRTFSGATVKIALTNGYTMNVDTHAGYADITNQVANGNGYTTGGATLAGLSISQDDTDNEGVLDCNDPAWTSATITADGAVVYIDSETTPVADAIACYLDIGSTTSTNGTFTVQIAAEGLINIASA